MPWIPSQKPLRQLRTNLPKPTSEACACLIKRPTLALLQEAKAIKDSPSYLHDGRCLTLEDSVEFFNLVFELKLSPEEKTDLVAFMRAL
jgi:hypothetical protein